MMDLPDAPWIRDAEVNGLPDAEEFEYSCPVCGADEPEDFYFGRDGEVCGCDLCVRRRDAYEYMAEKRAEERFGM